MTPYCSTIPMEDNDSHQNQDNSYSNYIGYSAQQLSIR
jgi:hypothetical protein